MSSFLTELLEHYHMSANDLAARRAPGSFGLLTTPLSLPAFQKVIARFDAAISKQEKVVIYGDYDVDGLTATAILVRALKERGLTPGYFIPSRYVEGYGLSTDRVKQFAAKGYSLVITVDNGISALEQVSEARRLGMDVVIIDHHVPASTLPETEWIFHQTLSGFLSYNCSAASLAYFVSQALLKHDDPYLATLAGIAVFSDVMPLTGNNLVFAKLALSFLNQNRYPNFTQLLGNPPYSYEDLSFRLIPSLNSPGRILKDSLATNHVAAFLIEKDDPSLIQKYGASILAVNQQRKDIVKGITFVDSQELSSDHGAVLKTESYPGLSGLFANKAMRLKNVPVAVFCPEEKDPAVLAGSLRVPGGYSLTPFLTANSKLFLSSGGHAKAAGLRIKTADYYKVATLFLSECEKQALEVKGIEEDAPLEMTLDDLSAENYSVFESFFPFGEGFPAPTFSLSFGKEEVVVSPGGKAAFVYGKDRLSKVVYFGTPEIFSQERYSYFTLIGNFTCETYNGKKSYVLQGDRIIPNL